MTAQVAPDVAPRPRPLVRAATSAGAPPALGGTAAVAVLIVAIISRGQVDPTTLALAAGAVLAAAGTIALTVLRTIRAGERMVTPTDNARGPDGGELVPRRDVDLGQVLIDMLAALQDLHDRPQPAPPLPTAPPAYARPQPVDAARPATSGPVVDDDWWDSPAPARDPASAQLPPIAPEGRHASRRRRTGG